MFRLVVATSLLVLVAGCTDPEPKEPKPTTSAAPTATAPTMPAQAKENTDEGAAAFVAHYIEVLNYASRTGDVAELSRLSDPDCTGCKKYIDLFRDTYSAGGSFSGGEWSPGAMRLDFGEPETYVTTVVKISAGEVKSGPDHEAMPEAPSTSTVSFGIAGQPWSVTQFGLGEAK